MDSCKSNEKQEANYLTIEEASAVLNIKVSRLRNLVFRKEIPYLKIGASIRFNKKFLIDWYESKAQEIASSSATNKSMKFGG